MALFPTAVLVSDTCSANNGRITAWFVSISTKDCMAGHANGESLLMIWIRSGTTGLASGPNSPRISIALARVKFVDVSMNSITAGIAPGPMAIKALAAP
jgi:hypothetical protein